MLRHGAANAIVIPEIRNYLWLVSFTITLHFFLLGIGQLVALDEMVVNNSYINPYLHKKNSYRSLISSYSPGPEKGEPVSKRS